MKIDKYIQKLAKIHKLMNMIKANSLFSEKEFKRMREHFLNEIKLAQMEKNTKRENELKEELELMARAFEERKKIANKLKEELKRILEEENEETEDKETKKAGQT